jgi:hypothetical protein
VGDGPAEPGHGVEPDAAPAAEAVVRPLDHLGDIMTFTRTHVFIHFADPFLRCDECGDSVPSWHNDDRCGCDAGFWNEPCGHKSGVTSACPSWSPVDGCRCTEPHRMWRPLVIPS